MTNIVCPSCKLTSATVADGTSGYISCCGIRVGYLCGVSKIDTWEHSIESFDPLNITTLFITAKEKAKLLRLRLNLLLRLNNENTRVIQNSLIATKAALNAATTELNNPVQTDIELGKGFSNLRMKGYSIKNQNSKFIIGCKMHAMATGQIASVISGLDKLSTAKAYAAKHKLPVPEHMKGKV